MTEIEKLYENAEVKADRIVCYRGFDNCIDNDFNCHCHNEKPCKDSAKIYPSFTAEKQLELIKWSARREPKVEIGYSSVYGYWVENQTDTRYYFGDQFDNALASLINSLWQDLTDADKAQIKEILSE